MNSKLLWVAALACAMAGVQTASAQTSTQTNGAKTRAQVQAECAAARKAGKILDGECTP